MSVDILIRDGRVFDGMGAVARCGYRNARWSGGERRSVPRFRSPTKPKDTSSKMPVALNRNRG